MEIDLVAMVTFILLMSGASRAQTTPPEATPPSRLSLPASTQAPPPNVESRVTREALPPGSTGGVPGSTGGVPGSTVGVPGSSRGTPGPSSPGTSLPKATAADRDVPATGNAAAAEIPTGPNNRSTPQEKPSSPAPTVTPTNTTSTTTQTPPKSSTTRIARTPGPWDPKVEARFKYDYYRLRVVGLTIGFVLFVLGILVVACGRLRRLPRCCGPSKTYQVKPVQDAVGYELVPTS